VHRRHLSPRFSGIGLLLSLSVLVVDQNISGEWF
jgi:hypothetical protein